MNSIQKPFTSTILFAVILLMQPSVSSSATLDTRAAAASAAADGAACSGLSFYWEIGNAEGEFRGGQRTALFGKPVSRQTQGLIASAGKWIYATYAIEKSGGAPDPIFDIPMLNFTSGYDKQRLCFNLDTVGSCGSLARAPFSPANEGRFSYGSAHMQHHGAADELRYLGISQIRSAALGPTIAAGLGIQSDTLVTSPERKLFQTKLSVGLKYSGPELAADAAIDAGTYASLLQKILSGALRMSEHLGSNQVCASDRMDSDGHYFCSSDGGNTKNVGYVPPLPPELDQETPANGPPWHYSLGHWVEKDGTFSGVGGFGFYPWIDKNKRWYGIIARFATSNVMAYQQSLVCGRAIRNAWLDEP